MYQHNFLTTILTGPIKELIKQEESTQQLTKKMEGYESCKLWPRRVYLKKYPNWFPIQGEGHTNERDYTYI